VQVVGAGPRRFIHQPHSVLLQGIEALLYIFDAVGYVVKPLPPFFQKRRDGRIRRRRLQQFKPDLVPCRTNRKKTDPHLLLRYFLNPLKPGAKNILVKRTVLLDGTDGYAYVMDGLRLNHFRYSRNSPTGLSTSMLSQKILNATRSGTASSPPATPHIHPQNITERKIKTGLSVSRRPMTKGVTR
jgi:hypothetical protein